MHPALGMCTCQEQKGPPKVPCTQSPPDLPALSSACSVHAGYTDQSFLVRSMCTSALRHPGMALVSLVCLALHVDLCSLAGSCRGGVGSAGSKARTCGGPCSRHSSGRQLEGPQMLGCVALLCLFRSSASMAR